ncbi:hypothetical protein ACH427_32020 [Streptomyces sp. NPDC020379]
MSTHLPSLRPQLTVFEALLLANEDDRDPCPCVLSTAVPPLELYQWSK